MWPALAAAHCGPVDVAFVAALDPQYLALHLPILSWNWTRTTVTPKPRVCTCGEKPSRETCAWRTCTFDGRPEGLSAEALRGVETEARGV